MKKIGVLFLLNSLKITSTVGIDAKLVLLDSLSVVEIVDDEML